MTDMNEEWRPIPGYEGLYSASSLGRIRSDRYDSGRTWPGRVLRPAPSRKGYLQLVLCRDKVQKTLKVHVLVAATFLGPCPLGFTVNHKHGNKLDNRPGELEYLSNLDNFLHAQNLGLLEAGYDKLRGEKCYAAKLTEADVRELRRAHAEDGVGPTALARRFGIGQTQASRIIKRQKWSHVI